MTIHIPRRHCVKKVLLLTDVTVNNNCAWNYIISLNEKNIYIGRKTMQTMRVYFVEYYIGCIVGGAWQGVS